MEINLKARHNKQPRVINVDKNAAYPPGFEERKEEEIFGVAYLRDESTKYRYFSILQVMK